MREKTSTGASMTSQDDRGDEVNDVVDEFAKRKMTRRKALTTAGGAVAGVVVGAVIAGSVGYFAGTASAPPGAAQTITQTQTVGAGQTATVTRTVTQTAAAGAAQTVTTTAPAQTVTVTAPAGEMEPIKIGLLTDLTGAVAPLGIPMANATTLAVEQINDVGGIMGHPIQLIIEDMATDLTVTVERTRKLVTSDRVDLLSGGITSASREAIRPIADQFQIPYVYTTWYEGGVCDLFNLIPAELPNQIWIPLFDYGFEKLGKKVFFFGADYNALRALSEVIKAYAPTKGGEVLGTELFPFTTTDFSGFISRLEAAQPDWMMGGLAGALGNTFLNQWYARGLHETLVPNDHFMDISRTEALIAGLDPEFTEGLLNAYSYVAAADTPENVRFLEAFRTRFPGAVLPDNVAEKMYAGMWLYKKAVEEAGTFTDFRAVRNSYVRQSVRAPCGLIEMDWRNNHAAFPVHIGQSDPSLEGRYRVIEKIDRVEPVVNGFPFFAGHNDPLKNECNMPFEWTASTVHEPAYWYEGA